MRQRLLTAFHAFCVIWNGEYHVFQSDTYTSVKGKKQTVDSAIETLSTYEFDDESQIRGYWQNITKPKV